MELIKTNYNFQGYVDSRQGGRPENQDHYSYSDTSHGLLIVVCDGMGGGPSGKLAATIAVQLTIDYVMHTSESEASDKVLKDAVTYAHKAILARQQSDPSTRGMGTTLSALLINSESAYVAHVGDSRVYQFRNGKVVFKTKDHSYVGELAQIGELSEEEARIDPRSNIITRCLGGKSKDLADIDGPLPYKKHDRFMLCSDGIWGAVPETELVKLAAKTPSLSGATDATVIAIDEKGRNDGNHHDNLTIALIDTIEDSQLQEPMSKTAKITIWVLSVLLAANFLFGLSQCNKANRYSNALQQIDTLQKELRQSRDSINYLKGHIKGSQEKGHDVNVYFNERTKDNEKDTVKENNKTSSIGDSEQIKTIINQIIEQLTNARDMPENANRVKIRADVTSRLNSLAEKDPANKNVYTAAVNELNKPMSKRTGDEGKGQYNHIIRIIDKVKK